MNAVFKIIVIASTTWLLYACNSVSLTSTVPVTEASRNVTSSPLIPSQPPPSAVTPTDHTPPSPLPIPLVSPVPVPPGYYLIKRGDTLTKISGSLNIKMTDLVAWNHITDPNRIEVDQLLRIIPPNPENTVTTIHAGSIQSVPTTPKPTVVGTAPTPPPIQSSPSTPHSTAFNATTETKITPTPNATQKLEPLASKTTPELSSSNLPSPSTTVSVKDFVWPLEGTITDPFNPSKNKGLKIASVTDSDILASSAGKVEFAGQGIKGYGNFILLRHDPNTLTVYAQVKQILIKEQQQVHKGQKIATVDANQPHPFYFEIRVAGKPVNPFLYLPAKP
ncbi:MAG: peptidoglycan DD-metalloendopeptidase family protein [Gammaproteobacteria bacterium]|nr:peptidoglycan DD-metalloendopeptidase family protein [Gammaproteobacteria bacterium]